MQRLLISTALLCSALLVFGEEEAKADLFGHAKDPEHMKEHVQEYGGTVDSLKEDEMLFHFFKEHDTDKNNKLDGLELAYALTHYDTKEGTGPATPVDDAEMLKLVDQVMTEQDKNNDGYIDYMEYTLAYGK